MKVEKKKFWAWTMYFASIAFLGLFASLYVFDKLNDYKREMQRLLNYHKIVNSRQDESIDILYDRLNHTDAHWQDFEERLEKLEWWSTHRY